MTVPFEGLLPRVPQIPAMVLPALVDEAFSRPSDRNSVKSSLKLPAGPLVGMVSALQASRRHDVAIEAFAKVRQRVPHAHLVVMGDGVEAEAIRRRILLHHLQEAVTCVGYRPASEFPRWLSAFDEVWILGLGNDFSARAAAQARKCGARVVGVPEGALPALADVVVNPTAEEVAGVALQSERSPKMIADTLEVAQRVINLYAQAVR
jgi:glycosyltransferase involved in cell wall biosynthesis